MSEDIPALEDEESYKVQLFDDAVCGGSAVGDVVTTRSKEFTSKRDGVEYTHIGGKGLGTDGLSRKDITGYSMQLTEDDGTEIGCCEIAVKERIEPTLSLNAEEGESDEGQRKGKKSGGRKSGGRKSGGRKSGGKKGGKKNGEGRALSEELTQN